MKPGRSARPPAPPEGPELDVVQQWFQAVISHPGGVAEGVESEEAQRRLALHPGEIERVVAPSKNLSAEERLGIYAYAYYARLLECLEDGFPVLARALEKEVFQSFAFEYLQRYPSRSYTLARLGEDFPRFLAETRPDRPPGEDGEAPSWPDFLIDLARLELAVVQIFDGPGVEGKPLLRPEDLEALGPERFAASRLNPVPCLRLLDCRYPVNNYYTAARRAAAAEAERREAGAEVAEEEEIPVPAPAPQHLALTRTEFVVRRYPLTLTQRTLLGELVGGATVGDAVAVAAERTEGADEALAAEIREAFRLFAAWGFFQGVRGQPPTSS